MSKKELKKYLGSLKKNQLEDQLLDLYGKFKPVKTYYDFVFNPNEEHLIASAKAKILKEYFPVPKENAKRKLKVKARRSVAQKLIKHFVQIGVEPSITFDLMIYNIDVAQRYSANKTITSDTFFKSMLNSFQEAVVFSKEHGLLPENKEKLTIISHKTKEQNWINYQGFENEVLGFNKPS